MSNILDRIRNYIAPPDLRNNPNRETFSNQRQRYQRARGSADFVLPTDRLPEYTPRYVEMQREYEDDPPAYREGGGRKKKSNRKTNRKSKRKSVNKKKSKKIRRSRSRKRH